MKTLSRAATSRCDYCGLIAVNRRALKLPDMPGIVHFKDEAWKGPPETTAIHYVYPVEFCSECENRFGAMAEKPIPQSIVEELISNVASWKVSEFPDEEV